MDVQGKVSTEITYQGGFFFYNLDKLARQDMLPLLSFIPDVKNIHKFSPAKFLFSKKKISALPVVGTLGK